ncbi:MAG TPA: non-ribosomal peptide synthetase, partial [Anaerolineae bacterium]|nr:non-ribosomal peptide synthetase [Anaerolineae bacterium]
MLPGPDLAKFMQDQAVTLAPLPPAALAALPAGSYPTLQTIISGGEACSREIVDRWMPGRRFVNAYGPTESTVAATWHVVENLSPQTSNVPIGRPIANTQLYILDKHQQPVPVGVPGELYIGGDGLARGYLNRPDLTAEKFVPLPVIGNRLSVNSNQSPTTNYRLPNTVYRTGDRCRYLPDGTVEFLERLDHQVKIRGFRIELGEIEAILAEHPDVRQAAAIVREDTPGKKRLAAYVLPEEDTAVSPPDLRQFLSQTLPAYMIPAAFVILDEMPLTPNGKVNRKALPAPDPSRPELAADFVAPRTPQEAALADVWAQLLGLEQVGIHDNFFELGGDSILSIQVITRAKQAGLHLTPKQLFQNPTIAELAAVAGSGPVIQAEQGIVTGDVPLTPIQYWFFAQNLPQPHHWNQAMLLEVTADLHPALLETAVSHILTHHDALRLRFRRDDGGWRQTNAAPDDEIPFSHIDLSDLPAERQMDALQAQAAFLQTSLDLTHGPLLRIAYFTMSSDQPDYLLFIIHHLAVDSISWRILLEDFQNAYLQLVQGGEVRFPPKSSSFRQWAQQLTQYAPTEAVTAELPFWQQIARQPIRSLPVDFSDSAADNSEASARSLTVSLTREETQALLQDVPTAYGTEINDVLLAALAQACARWTGAPGLLLHLEGHGREDISEELDISRTVGWFTSLFPIWLEAA